MRYSYWVPVVLIACIACEKPPELLSLPVEGTPDRMFDWGLGALIDPELVRAGTLEVRYCAAHFPAGSTALESLRVAVAAFNAVPGVAFNMPVLAADGTETHPDLLTFALPDHAIYVDYDQTLYASAWAALSWFATAWTETPTCNYPAAGTDPGTCSRARIYLSGPNYPSDDDPFNLVQAPSVGLFAHELGHAFGLEHSVPASAVARDATSLRFDRITVHGERFNGDDRQGAVFSALSLFWMRHYYGDSSSGLDIDELVVHPNIVILERVDRSAVKVTEWTMAKDFIYRAAGESIVSGLNETKLLYDATTGAYAPCASPAGETRWVAHFSETSTNTSDTLYAIGFEISKDETKGAWTRLETSTGLHSHEPGSEFRQIEWTTTLALTRETANISESQAMSMQKRWLAFQADLDDSLSERDEGNNRLEVVVCFYPEGDACSAPCEQE